MRNRKMSVYLFSVHREYSIVNAHIEDLLDYFSVCTVTFVSESSNVCK